MDGARGVGVAERSAPRRRLGYGLGAGPLGRIYESFNMRRPRIWFGLGVLSVVVGGVTAITGLVQIDDFFGFTSIAALCWIASYLGWQRYMKSLEVEWALTRNMRRRRREEMWDPW